MRTLKIVTAPDPGLQAICEPCDPGDKTLKKLAQRMAATMYKNNGCGLAAPQVGILKRLVVIDCGDPEDEPDPIYLINPEIIALEGEPELGGEGCLSLPGISVNVARQPFARVRYFDLDGDECIIEGDGLLGRCLQHEIDHLDGKTLFEACSPIDKVQALREYQDALARGAKPGEVEQSAEGRRGYANRFHGNSCICCDHPRSIGAGL